MKRLLQKNAGDLVYMNNDVRDGAYEQELESNGLDYEGFGEDVVIKNGSLEDYEKVLNQHFPNHMEINGEFNSKGDVLFSGTKKLPSGYLNFTVQGNTVNCEFPIQELVNELWRPAPFISNVNNVFYYDYNFKFEDTDAMDEKTMCDKVQALFDQEG